jgi:hypothetical protein
MTRRTRRAQTAAVSQWTLPMQQHQLERGLGLVLWIAFAFVLIRVAA